MSVRRPSGTPPASAPPAAGVSFAFSSSMLAQAAQRLQGQALPPLQNLAHRTASTEVALRPDKSFNLEIGVAVKSRMLTAGGTTQVVAREILANLPEAQRALIGEADIIVWARITGMPTDAERLMFAGIVRNLIVGDLGGLTAGKNARSEANRAAERPTPVTPDGAPHPRVSPCDGYKSAATMVWRLSTPEQQKKLRVRTGMRVDQRGDAVAQGLNPYIGDTYSGAARALAANILGPENAPRLITELTRPAQAAGSDRPGPAVVEEWTRTKIPSAAIYEVKYRLVYTADKDDDDEGPDRRRQRTNDGGIGGGGRAPGAGGSGEAGGSNDPMEM